MFLVGCLTRFCGWLLVSWLCALCSECGIRLYFGLVSDLLIEGGLVVGLVFVV